MILNNSDTRAREEAIEHTPSSTCFGWPRRRHAPWWLQVREVRLKVGVWHVLQLWSGQTDGEVECVWEEPSRRVWTNRSFLLWPERWTESCYGSGASPKPRRRFCVELHGQKDEWELTSSWGESCCSRLPFPALPEFFFFLWKVKSVCEMNIYSEQYLLSWSKSSSQPFLHTNPHWAVFQKKSPICGTLHPSYKYQNKSRCCSRKWKFLKACYKEEPRQSQGICVWCFQGDLVKIMRGTKGGLPIPFSTRLVPILLHNQTSTRHQISSFSYFNKLHLFPGPKRGATSPFQSQRLGAGLKKEMLSNQRSSWSIQTKLVCRVSLFVVIL